MKITKKQPLRPRGRSDEKRQSTKDAIREAYANGPQKEVQIIPAKKDLVTDAEKKNGALPPLETPATNRCYAPSREHSAVCCQQPVSRSACSSL